ncbi:MAG: FUSC family protein [Pseudomonadota bacterium]
MATRAAETERGIARALASLLRPEPTQLELCLRLAIICTLTTLVVEIYRTPLPALAAYIVFFMNRPDRVTSVIANVVLVLLLTFVIGLVLGIALLVLDDSQWRVIAIAVLSFAFMFLTSASKLRPIGGTLALVTAYALDLVGATQGGDEVTRALLYIWLCFAIAGAVSVVVNLLLAPAPRRLAERALARRLNVAADVLQSPDASARSALAKAREGNAEVLKWLHLAALEKTSAPELLAALGQAAGAVVSLFAALEVMLAHPQAMLPAALREELARLVDQVATELWRGRPPSEAHLRDAIEAPSLSASAAALVTEFKLILRDFSEPRVAEAPAPPAEAEPKGFFLADAFTNPDHVRFALRSTLAALFCYLLYSLLVWPGIHTCLITVFIVSLGTVGESVEKLTLRILGCLLGGAAGIGAIVFLVPSLTSIGHLMIVMFAGSLLAGYIAAGSPRVAYAGFQLAFAFFLCLLEGSGPSFDLVKARDRILGILLGNLVAYLALSSFWPVSIGRRVDPAIARLLAGLSALSGAIGVGRRRVLAAQLDAQLAAVETDLAIAHYEPIAIRPSSAWLAARADALEAIAVLKAPLLLAADDEGARARHAARLRALADLFSTHAPAPASEGAPSAASAAAPFDGIVDGQLEQVDRVVGRLFELGERPASIGQA